MGGVDAEHLLEAAVDDQDPVEAFAAEGGDPALGVRIRIRSSDGRPDDPHAVAAEDLVEGLPPRGVEAGRRVLRGERSAPFRILAIGELEERGYEYADGIWIVEPLERRESG
jgi:hypothetical protein